MPLFQAYSPKRGISARVELGLLDEVPHRRMHAVRAAIGRTAADVAVASLWRRAGTIPKVTSRPASA
jgi:hypothetical protein